MKQRQIEEKDWSKIKPGGGAPIVDGPLPHIDSFEDYIKFVLNRTPIRVTESEEEAFKKYRHIFLEVGCQRYFYERNKWKEYHPVPTIAVGDLSQVDRYWWRPRKRREVLAELVATLPSEKRVQRIFKRAKETARRNWLKQVTVKHKSYEVIFNSYQSFQASNIDCVLELIIKHDLSPANTYIFSC